MKVNTENIEANSTSNSGDNGGGGGGGGSSVKTTIPFIKQTKQRNIRKRSDDDLILNIATTNNKEEEETEEKDKKKIKSKINQYTTVKDKKNEFSYDSSGNAGSSINTAELSTTQYLNEEDEYQEQVVLKGRQTGSTDTSNNNDDGVYRGMKSYSSFVEKKAGGDLSYKGGGVKAGPIKTASTVKLSSRIDFQPDVCKDYKQTGQCTFGDACKFLHDRSDYKSGWQIDKEYEEEQKQKRLNNINGVTTNDTNSPSSTTSSTTEEFPFACYICKNQYNNPVMTKCKHYFCEDCALTHNRKSKKCALCSEPTMGAFTTPAKKQLDKLLEISKLHFEKLNK